MWIVEYSYYNYPRLTKSFKTYESAKKFFWFIQKKSGVRTTELKEA